MIRNESEILNVGMSKPPKPPRWRADQLRGGAAEQKMCE